MKKILSLIVFIIAALEMLAQTEIQQSILNLSIEAAANGSFFREGTYEGSPYAEKEASTGLFYQKNKTVVETQTKLNYFYNSFEFLSDGISYLVVPNTVDSVIIKNQKYLFRTFSINGISKTRVVNIISSIGNNSLYSYTHVEFEPEVKAGGYIDPKPARFVWSDPIYIYEINNQIIPLINFNKLTDAFPAKKNEIKKYIKKNKISKTKPNGLIKLLAFIDNI